MLLPKTKLGAPIIINNNNNNVNNVNKIIISSKVENESRVI